MRYESELGPQVWERKLSALAGVAGFSPVVDAMIEVVGQQLMRQALPSGYVVDLERANTIAPAGASLARSAAGVEQRSGGETLRRQLSDGCMAWIYLGHGDRTVLEHCEIEPQASQIHMADAPGVWLAIYQLSGCRQHPAIILMTDVSRPSRTGLTGRRPPSGHSRQRANLSLRAAANSKSIS